MQWGVGQPSCTCTPCIFTVAFIEQLLKPKCINLPASLPASLSVLSRLQRTYVDDKALGGAAHKPRHVCRHLVGRHVC